MIRLTKSQVTALNGIQLSYTQEELIELIFALAAGTLSQTMLTQWLREHVL